MESSGKFNYLFRKHPFLRCFFVFLIICIILSVFFVVKFRSQKIPTIHSIYPPVGSPGDVVQILGENFGSVRDINYVEIAGMRLTSSSYLFWSDNQIRIVLPSNVQDGFVFVGTKNKRSKPVLFANEVDIPVPVPVVIQTNTPIIQSFSSEKVEIGEILTIYGMNFGDSQNHSKVLFTIDYSGKIKGNENPILTLLTENMISANENDFDYVLWSDSEIKVRVPDGACSGVVIVDNGKEKSLPKELTIRQDAGFKSFKNRKIYLLQYSADIDDIVSDGNSTITLRCPLPSTFVSQPTLELTEISPEPILRNYKNCLIHQMTNLNENSQKQVFKQTFVLPVYEIQTQINEGKIGNYENCEQNMMNISTSPDRLIPSNDEQIIELAKKIVEKQKNPYKKAKLIYEFMCENFKLLEENRKNDENPLDVLRTKYADSYDLAVIFTALLRSVDIPCLTDAGILVSQDLATKPHWWCEFYIDKVGWIPVDVSLGCKSDEDRLFYFGNLDSYHIAFSRGWNQLKPFSVENKIVQQPKNFALQSIWEESSENTKKYSSYWSVPVVKGVY